MRRREELVIPVSGRHSRFERIFLRLWLAALIGVIVLVVGFGWRREQSPSMGVLVMVGGFVLLAGPVVLWRLRQLGKLSILASVRRGREVRCTRRGITVPTSMVAGSHQRRLIEQGAPAMTLRWRDIEHWVVTRAEPEEPQYHVLHLRKGAAGGSGELRLERGPVGPEEERLLGFVREIGGVAVRVDT